MPRPSSSTTLRPELAALAYEFLMNAPFMGFIGLRLLPIFMTALQNAQYPKIIIESFLKTLDTKRAARGGYSRSDYEFETGSYTCEDHGFEDLLDDSEKRQFARLFDAEVVSLNRAMFIIMLAQEKRIASMLFNSSNLTVTNVTNEWSDATNATPLADVTAKKQLIRAASGLNMNVGACSLKVFENLIKTDEVRDAFKNTSMIETRPRLAQIEAMASYFGLDDIFVSGVQYDSAKKGQSFSLSDVWDDEYFGLFRVAPQGSMDLMEPVIGRTFLWTEDSPQNMVVETYREEDKRSDVTRARHNVDEAFVFQLAGGLLGNITE